MKIQILEDLYYEINRLFIAGDRFAANDPRISKLIPQLEKLGEKSPAIKKLAELTKELITDSEKGKLGETANLLYSILNTQGSAELSGEYEKIEIPKEMDANSEFAATELPYSKLKPIIESLTGKYGGRATILREAYNNDEYKDFRLYQYYSKGLEDNYFEIPNFLFKHVIPSVGAPMIEPLLADLKNIISGNKVEARRLELLADLKSEKAEEIAQEVLKESKSTAMICAALKALGNNSKNEKELLQFADDKKSDVVTAALVGLAKINSEKGNKKILEVLSGKNRKFAFDACAVSENPEILEAILKLADDIHEKLASDILANKNDILYNENYNNLMKLLKIVLRHKTDDIVYDFYKKLFTDSRMWEGKGLFASSHIYDEILSSLSMINTNREHEFLDELLSREDVFHSTIISHYFVMVHTSSSDSESSKKEFFDKFSPYYYNDIASIDNYSWREYLTAANFLNLDKEWFHLFLEKQNLNMAIKMLDYKNELNEIDEKIIPKAKNILIKYTGKYKDINEAYEKREELGNVCRLIIAHSDDNEREQIGENIMKLARTLDDTAKKRKAFFSILKNFDYRKVLAKPKFIKELEELTETKKLDEKLGVAKIQSIIYKLKNTPGVPIEEETKETESKKTKSKEIKSAKSEIKKDETNEKDSSEKNSNKEEIPYSKIEPIILALTTKQKNRGAILDKNMYVYVDPTEEERAKGIVKRINLSEECKDSRLYPYYSKGLEDKFINITDLLFESIIPRIGAPMIDALLADFEAVDDKVQARRFELLYKIGCEKIDSLALEVLEKCSRTDMLSSALKALGNNPKNEESLLQYANEKKGDIVSAALVGLAKINSEEGNKKIASVLASKKYKAAIDAYAMIDYPDYADEFLNAVSKAYDIAIDKFSEKKPPVDFVNLISKCLRDKTDDKVYNLFKKILTDERMAENPYDDIVQEVIACLALKNTVREHTLLDEVLNTEHIKHPTVVSMYFIMAHSSELYSKEELFDKFSPHYVNDVDFRSREYARKLNFNEVKIYDLDKWFELFLEKEDFFELAEMLYHDDVIDEKIIKKAKEILLTCADNFHKFSTEHPDKIDYTPSDRPRKKINYEVWAAVCKAITLYCGDDERDRLALGLIKFGHTLEEDKIGELKLFAVLNRFKAPQVLARSKFLNELEELNKKLNADTINYWIKGLKKGRKF